MKGWRRSHEARGSAPRAEGCWLEGGEVILLVILAVPLSVLVISRLLWPVCSCEMSWGRDPCCQARLGECWFDQQKPTT